MQVGDTVMAAHGSDDQGLSVTFWGVRGALPTPGPTTLRYGGNTSCIELRCGPHLLIVDAGSGMRGLGTALAASGVAVVADILMTHTHMDHISGLPFFGPIFDPRSRLRFWGGHLEPGGLAAALRISWRPPLMPDMEPFFKAGLAFADFQPGAVFSPYPDLLVRTCRLNHPGGAVGYRIEWGGKSVCVITDTEHEPAGFDPALLAMVAGADMMIYDSNYTDAEYGAHIGWGHSTWQQALRLADAASVKTVVLFHHDPRRDDAMLDEIARSAASVRPGTLAAREGMVLRVGARQCGQAMT
jgi:phosphoribosyl 1,2-cyclic phosphodiesterase